MRLILRTVAHNADYDTEAAPLPYKVLLCPGNVPVTDTRECSVLVSDISGSLT